MKDCERCGEAFQPRAGGIPQRYCSKACRTNAAARVGLTCETCGQTFDAGPIGKVPRYCTPGCMPSRNSTAPCRVDDCPRAVIARGMCQPHYDRWRRYGDTDYRPIVACESCGADVRATFDRPRFCESCGVSRHRQRTRARRHHNNMKAYGLTPDDYARMLREQGGRCAICRGGATGKGATNGRLSVDHDHTTGAVRALLCSNCNGALGLFQDSPNLLVAAAAYLITHAPTTDEANV